MPGWKSFAWSLEPMSMDWPFYRPAEFDYLPFLWWALMVCRAERALFVQKRCWKHKAYLSVRAGGDSNWPSGFHWSSKMKPSSPPASLWALWFTDRNFWQIFTSISMLGSSSGCRGKGDMTSSAVFHLRHYVPSTFYTTWTLIFDV